MTCPSTFINNFSAHLGTVCKKSITVESIYSSLLKMGILLRLESANIMFGPRWEPYDALSDPLVNWGVTYTLHISLLFDAFGVLVMGGSKRIKGLSYGVCGTEVPVWSRAKPMYEVWGRVEEFFCKAQC